MFFFLGKFNIIPYFRNNKYEFYGQLFSELKELFSNNHVEYFVLYYSRYLKPLLFWAF